MRNLNARVLILQGSYCAMQCVSTVFFVQAFQRFGYDNTLIGIIMTLTGVVAITAQPFWGFIADKVTRDRLIIGGCSGIAAVLYFIFTFSGGRKPLVIAMSLGIYAIFHPVMHLIDAWISKLIMEGYQINYGATRSGGSVAFAATSLIFGIVVARFGMTVAPFIYTGIYIIMLATLAGMPDVRATRAVKSKVSIRNAGGYLAQNRTFIIFVLAYLLMSFTNIPANTFYSVVVYGMGGNEFHVGVSQFIQAACEIPTMLLFNTIRRKTGWHPRIFIIVAMVFYSLKTAFVAFAPSLGFVLAANVLQGLSFALFLPASLAFLMETVRREYLSTAQMLSVSLGSSAASIIANYVCGVTADAMGAQNMLRIMFIFALFGAVLMLFAVQPSNLETLRDTQLEDDIV